MTEARKRELERTVSIIVFVLLTLAPIFVRSQYPFFVLCLAVINGIAVMGLNFIFGFAGQLHMGVAAFLGIGSYAFSLAAVKYGWNWWAAAILSIIVVGIFSLFLGFPTLRLKRYYLAIMTIGFQEITRSVLMNWSSFTGGVFGIQNIPRPSLFGLQFTDNRLFYYLALILSILLYLLAIRIERSRFGRALRAVRDDELAAEAMGMNSTFLKVFAFIWCGAYSAVAGTLYASFQQYVSPELYTSAYSFSFVSMLVFGGIGSVPGAVLGATALTVLMELLRFMKQWYLVIYAAAIIVIIVYEPYGLMGILTRMRTKRLAAAELSEGARDASL
ncbi:MAG: branched-chain amino acid ABC transporter permease [Firmicutes bacterium]|jgi:branched-chain amino acid transport system permease protein|nr:branched-chain amino acid ABC transporter permease [Bacillota bacterium]